MIQNLGDNPQDSIFKFVEDWSKEWTLQKKKEKREWWNYNKDKTIKLLCRTTTSNKLLENSSWYKNNIRKKMIDMDRIFQQRTIELIFEQVYLSNFTHYLNQFLAVHFNTKKENKYKTYLKLRRYVFANIDYNFLFKKIAMDLYDHLFDKKLDKQQKQWIFIKTRIAFSSLFEIVYKVLVVLISKDIYLYFLFKRSPRAFCKDCVQVLYYYILDLLEHILYKEYEKLKSTVLHIKTTKEYYKALEECVVVRLKTKLINYVIPKLKRYYRHSSFSIFQTLVTLRLILITWGLLKFKKKRKWKTKRQRFEAKNLKEFEKKKQRRLTIKRRKKMWIKLIEEVETVTEEKDVMKLKSKYRFVLLGNKDL